MSDRCPPNSELTTLLTCSSAQSNGSCSTGMPTDCARNNKNASEELESVNSAMITRKYLKLLSKPRSDKRGGAATTSSFFAGRPCLYDSRTKNVTTITAARAGTDANKKMLE